jgi:hypothetical protein
MFAQIQTLHRVMQTHLCRTLAHHMVYLGTRLGLPISSAMERFILDAADSMWNKEGHFIWNFNWKTANAEYDTDDDDKPQWMPSIDHDHLELEVEKWPVCLTEAHYSGDGRGPQESDSSAGYGEFPFSYFPVIEDMQIPEYLNHGAALNIPPLEISSMLAPDPEAERVRCAWKSLENHLRFSHATCFVIASCSSASCVTESDVRHPLQEVIRKWLLL